MAFAIVVIVKMVETFEQLSISLFFLGLFGLSLLVSLSHGFLLLFSPFPFSFPFISTFRIAFLIIVFFFFFFFFYFVFFLFVKIPIIVVISIIIVIIIITIIIIIIVITTLVISVAVKHQNPMLVPFPPKGGEVTATKTRKVTVEVSAIFPGSLIEVPKTMDIITQVHHMCRTWIVLLVLIVIVVVVVMMARITTIVLNSILMVLIEPPISWNVYAPIVGV